jgi:protein kinase A
LLENLIQVDPTKRLGNLRDGVYDVLHHPWFNSIDYMKIYNKQVEAPFIPKIDGPGDHSNFDNFEEEELRVDPMEEFPIEFFDF